MRAVKMSSIYVGQSLALDFTIRDEDQNIVDISTFTPTLYLKRIGGTVLELTPGFYTDGTDGIVVYQITTELDKEGEWQMQVKVVKDLEVYFTDIISIKVLAHL